MTYIFHWKFTIFGILRYFSEAWIEQGIVDCILSISGVKVKGQGHQKNQWNYEFRSHYWNWKSQNCTFCRAWISNYLISHKIIGRGNRFFKENNEINKCSIFHYWIYSAVTSVILSYISGTFARNRPWESLQKLHGRRLILEWISDKDFWEIFPSLQ